jgi:hypothetical protein
VQIRKSQVVFMILRADLSVETEFEGPEEVLEGRLVEAGDDCGALDHAEEDGGSD